MDNTALILSSLAISSDPFFTKATSIDDIDTKGHKMERKQSYKVKITLLVIYGLGGIQTLTLILSHNRRAPACGQHASG